MVPKLRVATSASTMRGHVLKMVAVDVEALAVAAVALTTVVVEEVVAAEAEVVAEVVVAVVVVALTVEALETLRETKSPSKVVELIQVSGGLQCKYFETR